VDAMRYTPYCARVGPNPTLSPHIERGECKRPPNRALPPPCGVWGQGTVSTVYAKGLDPSAQWRRPFSGAALSFLALVQGDGSLWRGAIAQPTTFRTIAPALT
jgi:hypothetical protein